MGRGNVKEDFPYNRDWGRKPYVSKNYHAMMRLTPNAAIWKTTVEKHSEFEKPYLKDHNYHEMQHYHPSNFRQTYRPPVIDTNPDGGVTNPCAEAAAAGAFNATSSGGEFPTVDCEETLTLGALNGVAPFSVGFVGGLTGVGSITESKAGVITYTAPPCACCEEGFDNVAIIDSCGRFSNIIIKITCGGLADLQEIVGPDAPSNGDQYFAVGGSAPYEWSITPGSIDESGIVTVAGECGPGLVTVIDACGATVSKSIRMPGGSWILGSAQPSQGCWDLQERSCGPFYLSATVRRTFGVKQDFLCDECGSCPTGDPCGVFDLCDHEDYCCCHAWKDETWTCP